MSREKDSCILMAVLFPVLPWMLTVVLLGRTACPLSKKPDIEAYTASVAASQISWAYEQEAIRAQVVLARTNLYANPDKQEEMIQEAARYIKKQQMDSKMLKKYEIFQKAARETEGQILEKDGEVRELPYHALSGGKTREGKEVLGEAFSYIPSVETAKDIDSPLYVEGCYFSQKELEKQLKRCVSGISDGGGNRGSEVCGRGRICHGSTDWKSGLPGGKGERIASTAVFLFYHTENRGRSTVSVQRCGTRIGNEPVYGAANGTGGEELQRNSAVFFSGTRDFMV